MFKKLFFTAAAAAAVSVPLAGAAWAEPPSDPSSTDNGMGRGGMPEKLGNFVDSGVAPDDLPFSAPLPPGEVINGLAKADNINTPDAVAGFESNLWGTHTLVDGTPLPSNLDEWGNITPGLAIKPLTPGCDKGRSAVPGSTQCVG